MIESYSDLLEFNSSFELFYMYDIPKLQIISQSARKMSI